MWAVNDSLLDLIGFGRKESEIAVFFKSVHNYTMCSRCASICRVIMKTTPFK